MLPPTATTPGRANWQRPNPQRHGRTAGDACRGQKCRTTAEGPGTVEGGGSGRSWRRARIRLSETLVFEPQDSGTAEAPIVYQAAEGARPILTGGRKIQVSLRPRAACGRSICPRSRPASGISRTCTSMAAVPSAPARPTSSTTTFAARSRRQSIRPPASRADAVGRLWPTPRTSRRWRRCPRNN